MYTNDGHQQICGDQVCRTIAGIPLSILPSRLRIVITPAGAGLGNDPFVAAFHPDMSAVLVVKGQRDEALIVTRHLAATWPVSAAKLWDDALDGMGVEPLGVQSMTVGGQDTPAYAIIGQGWPGAGHVFRLDRVLGRPLPNGALVILGNDNSLFAIPLDANAALNATFPLWEVANNLAGDAATPLPVRLFWVRGWTVHDLRAGIADGKFGFDLPEELKAVVARLP